MTEPTPGTALTDRLAALDPAQRAALDRALRARAAGPAAPGSPPAGTAPAPERVGRQRRAGSTMAFSLFFFSGDGSTAGPDKYRLLLDCARFADAHGFAAVWVPERHFVDFGGLYPNPAVLAAALAVVTERVELRAGSVVLPLHHPVRVAEEWAVVDNLSGGRAAISAASGWHPHDFALAPGGPARYAHRRADMFAAIETVRRLWSGAPVTVPTPDGDREVRPLPRPVRPELPVWVSAAGTLATYERAGAIGANLLTGVVGHRLSELGDKIAAYRAARAAGGHDPAAGTVTVMLHAYLGDDADAARAAARGPLTGYLETFLRQLPGPAGGFGDLDDAGRAAMLDAAFDRYARGLALLGTPDTAEDLVETLVDLDVDEIACLVDFGLPAPAVRAGLTHLRELHRRYRPEGTDD
ncbi:siderophore biosynthesis protein [Pilimelia anulata]|uniref:Siderophore biosynthesis protein n=1 Tax=Pilimelia anulata TaxID=53371 RepID=A0A8J3BE11_9ACTN|nr:MupA/Atu3671 family FMN-dependent luciferase-like monooxygenase [Pilimelia anulata]GGK03625.1 siderophore biosynthesis protein [Pilimelia anulata]